MGDIFWKGIVPSTLYNKLGREHGRRFTDKKECLEALASGEWWKSWKGYDKEVAEWAAKQIGWTTAIERRELKRREEVEREKVEAEKNKLERLEQLKREKMERETAEREEKEKMEREALELERLEREEKEKEKKPKTATGKDDPSKPNAAKIINKPAKKG